MRGPMVRWLVAGTLISLALLISAAGASALTAVYTVSSGTDGSATAACVSDVCPSLRAAVNAADNLPGSTIQLSATTYTLNTAAGALPISASVTITGAGPGMTTIDQTEAGDGVVAVTGGTVAITGVTITGGKVVGAAATSPNSNGGAGEGGGLFVDDNSGTLTLTDDAVTGNTAKGGAPSGSGTTGYGYGGGIYSQSQLVIVDTTLSDNSALGSGSNPTGGYGGAMIASATTTIEDSTVGPGNVASYAGGGIETSSNPVTIVNSTIAGNSAGSSSGGYGGGLVLEGTDTLANDTIAENAVALTSEGGNLATVSGAAATLEGTIIAGGKPAGAANNCATSGSQLIDGGHDLEDDTSTQCHLTAASDKLVTSADLASTLAANGGPTDTLALLTGAPEIGAGGACTNPAVSGSPALTLDQRGLPRPAACDIGALQTQEPANTTAPTVSPAAATVGQTLTCSPGTWTGDGELTAADAIGSLAYSYVWLDGTTPISGATAATYATAASDAGQTVSCKVTATGAYGTATATSSNGAAVTAPPVVTTTSPTTTTTVTPTPTPKPKITAFTQSATRWLEGRAKGKLKHGTAFHLKLSTAATVTLTFTQATTGRKVGGKCVAVSRGNAKRAHCSRTVTRGTLKLSAEPGTSTITFTGKLSHTTLAPGTYTVTVTARNSAGAATARKLTFTIVKP